MINGIHVATASTRRLALLVSTIVGIVFASTPLRAETGYDAWLRYAPIDDRASREQYDSLPATVVTLGDSEILTAAETELVRGVRGMLGRTLRESKALPDESAIVLGTYEAVLAAIPAAGKPPQLPPDGFWIKSLTVDGRNHLLIAAPNERGVLYGAFTLLRMIGLEVPITELNIRDKPYASIRFLNHWDNLDGTIERGYAGRSIFWENGHVVKDLGRVRDYARLMASVGINGCSINNVNADARVISADLLPEVARVAAVFRPYGVKLFLSLDFASPRKIGGIDTFDPLDPAAVAFWKRKVDEVYKAVPDLGGFVLKADSEGRLGPSEYGRTHADAANVIAQALEPHGGILFYRGFVYDHKMDWKNLKNDRAAPPTTISTSSTANSSTTSSSKSSTARSTSKSASPLRRCSAGWPRPIRRSNCRSRRNTSASSGTWCISCRCGRKCSTSTSRPTPGPRAIATSRR